MRAVKKHAQGPVDGPLHRAVAESASARGGRPRWCSVRRARRKAESISPLLANLFLHYAFDRWMAKQYPHLPFERYRR